MRIVLPPLVSLHRELTKFVGVSPQRFAYVSCGGGGKAGISAGVYGSSGQRSVDILPPPPHSILLCAICACMTAASILVARISSSVSGIGSKLVVRTV